MKDTIKQYILDRAKEASTWRGAILLLTAAGLHITPDMANVIITVGLSLAGGIGVAVPDKK